MKRACVAATWYGCTALAAVAALAGPATLPAVDPVSAGSSLPLQRHAVHAERVGHALRVNGLRVEAWYLTGAGLRPMVDEVARVWRSSRQYTDAMQGRWRVVARRQGGRGEVLQFDAAAGEALFSWLDTRWPVSAPAAASLLPAGCRAGGTVEDEGAGAALLQLSARCVADAATVAARVRALAVAKGWHERPGATGHGLVFERSGRETRVFVEPVPPGSGLVLLQWSPGRQR